MADYSFGPKEACNIPVVAGNPFLSAPEEVNGIERSGQLLAALDNLGQY